MSTSVKSIARILCAASVALILSACGKRPSDASLIANFRTHKATLVELQHKICKDGYSTVSMDPEWSDPADIPATVKQTYYVLMKEAGVEQIQSRESCGAEFIVWSVGLGGSGEYKGYFYKPDYKAEIVDNLDNVKPNDITFYLRKIEGDWYLYYNYWP